MLMPKHIWTRLTLEEFLEEESGRGMETNVFGDGGSLANFLQWLAGDMPSMDFALDQPSRKSGCRNSNLEGMETPSNAGWITFRRVLPSLLQLTTCRILQDHLTVPLSGPEAEGSFPPNSRA